MKKLFVEVILIDQFAAAFLLLFEIMFKSGFEIYLRQ